jgi:hypothetical protein
VLQAQREQQETQGQQGQQELLDQLGQLGQLGQLDQLVLKVTLLLETQISIDMYQQELELVLLHKEVAGENYE